MACKREGIAAAPVSENSCEHSFIAQYIKCLFQHIDVLWLCSAPQLKCLMQIEKQDTIHPSFSQGMKCFYYCQNT